MKLDRKKYIGLFLQKNFPQLQCPKCKNGILEISKDGFRSEPTKSSREAYEEINEISFIILTYRNFKVA